jgi:hypothetical protein
LIEGLEHPPVDRSGAMPQDRGRLLNAARKVLKGQDVEADVADVASAAGVGMGLWFRVSPQERVSSTNPATGKRH